MAPPRTAWKTTSSGLKLRKKREALETVDKYLDLLSQQPAAAEGFLDPAEIFKNATQLPEIPKAVVSGCNADEDAARSELKALTSHLEKHVLQAKLLLAREGQSLENVRSRLSSLPETIGDGVRLRALGASRRELIAWIESELGKVSGGESELSADVPLPERKPAAADKAHMDDQLASIKEKYARYVTARKSLVQTVSQRPQPVVLPQLGAPGHVAAQPPNRPPVTYLLSPYLENLLSVAHEQKGLIAQKSHLNIALAKQLKDTYPSHRSPGRGEPALAKLSFARTFEAEAGSRRGPRRAREPGCL